MIKITTFTVAVIIGIVLIYFAYDYLRKLENCMCAQGMFQSEDRKADITKLKYIELLLLVIALANFFFAFKNKLSPLLSTIFFFFMLAVYIIFIMNVVKLYNNMPSDCECAIQWPRYYIYLQSILMTLTLITFFVAIFVFVYASKVMKGKMLKGRK
jgi:hypothetical protein